MTQEREINLSEKKIEEIREAIQELKRYIAKEKQIIKEMNSLTESLKNIKNIQERKMIISHIISLKDSLRNIGNTVEKILLIKTAFSKPLIPIKEEANERTDLKEIEKNEEIENKPQTKIILPTERLHISELEKRALKRIKKREKRIASVKIKKPSLYIKTASNLFYNISRKLIKKELFRTLERDLIKANLQFIPANYISILLFTTFLSIIASLFLFSFFLFFDIGAVLPIITITKEDILTRITKFFWILFLIPIGTAVLMYFYPSMERSSIGYKIDEELPFATIHMSAISASMVDPTEIFRIIMMTKEYPHLEKEFTKLLNEVNIYGYDFISALRNIAFYSPSIKLTELFNGLATTIYSGGKLPEFFDKRAQSLLFEYKLEREKQNKASETFMDIYISVVVAAPMILMLLLMMMKISGIGLSLSTSMITAIIISAVTVINIVFIAFLHLKQPNR